MLPFYREAGGSLLLQSQQKSRSPNKWGIKVLVTQFRRDILSPFPYYIGQNEVTGLATLKDVNIEVGKQL